MRRKAEVQKICNSKNFSEQMIDSKNLLCGYNKYFNWDLTIKSKVINGSKIKSEEACPFRFGLNQLWRNMLLAEQVATARHCDEFGFWVFSPTENRSFLWNGDETENNFRKILTEQGNKHFQSITLESILDKLQTIVIDDADKNWLTKMNAKYRIA